MDAPVAVRGSHFVDADAAREALRVALPMIEAQMQTSHVCGSGFLYIVIMDPALGPGDAEFDRAVLHEHAVGDRTRWDADYAAFARAKAAVSWREGRSGHELQMLAPHRLRRGDTLLWGAVVLDGIVVGVSGAHAPWDEAFATTVAACLKAVGKQRRQAALYAGTLSAV
jgi:hypothetical protein